MITGIFIFLTNVRHFIETIADRDLIRSANLHHVRCLLHLQSDGNSRGKYLSEAEEPQTGDTIMHGVLLRKSERNY